MIFFHITTLQANFELVDLINDIPLDAIGDEIESETDSSDVDDKDYEEENRVFQYYRKQVTPEWHQYTYVLKMAKWRLQKSLYFLTTWKL